MKQILLVGESQPVNNLASKIIIDEVGICLYDPTVFSAIKTLYSKKIDVLVISYHEMCKNKLDYVGYVRSLFSTLRIFVLLDNGFNCFEKLPENVSLINDEEEFVL